MHELCRPAPCILCRPALQRVRASRDQAAVDAVLAQLEAVAHSNSRDSNLLDLAVQAARLR